MAVTKTHPIKSTLKAAIDYILNPEKTDGKLLASSFGCGLETADIEFAWTREAAGDRGTHLGRHLIQSFAVGETTPEEAHKIGMELAGAVLGGKYELLLIFVKSFGTVTYAISNLLSARNVIFKTGDSIEKPFVIYPPLQMAGNRRGGWTLVNHHIRVKAHSPQGVHAV